MSVTILIVNYNSGKLLARCLTHLVRQTVLPEKIIIIDNASTDHSADCAESIENIVIHKLDKNLGFASANNYCLTSINTKFTVLLNPDAFPEQNWLELLIKAANEHPDYSMFGCRLLKSDNPRILDGDGDKYHVSGLAWRGGHGKFINFDIATKEIFSPCAAAAMYRTKDILAVGGFDDDYFCYFEDVDLGFRMRLLGQKCLLVPTAIVHHIGSATTGGQHSDFSVYHGHRNLVWAYIKNMPGLLFWLFLPYHVVLNIISIIVFVARGQGSVIFKAKWDAIKGSPAMWRKRKIIQSNRVASLRDIWRVLDKQIIPWTR